MDLIIKNLERLKDYSNGNHKPIERVVVDFDKLATEDFTQLFFNACEKYVEVGESYLVPNEDIKKAMEPAEPTLKEATERMKGEFDATGKDVKIFMNERIIKE